ncbi:hypothetical protein Rs2_10108 [Raphanus sativus]|uniref:Uncharacterized protein LOC108845205 n=1 Tax=Raphanus sativus TaxID=3726 RepID=A0A6J0MPX2_RAPSA|nr:uncharacterized protein LOC108845205 [Raphanus sativus]KAJ4906450.1 hypothetical protein Rs2_10108 [Raphanus sativus]
MLNLPRGGSVLIEFEYEKLMKRCHHCYRLTHERPDCPVLHNRNKTPIVKKQSAPQRPDQPQSSSGAHSVSSGLKVPLGFTPLFPELPTEERNAALLYISHSDETERLARIARVQQSIPSDAVVASPTITHDLLKGKGHVFTFEEPQRLSKKQNVSEERSNAPVGLQRCDNRKEVSSASELEGASSSSLPSPTGFSIGTSHEVKSAGPRSGVKSSRKRPQRFETSSA